MGRGEECIEFWWGNLRERDHWGESDGDGNTILRWIIRKWDVGIWTGLSWLRIQTMAGSCECGNKTSESIKFGEILDWLQTG
jgi:hypothetical protein